MAAYGVIERRKAIVQMSGSKSMEGHAFSYFLPSLITYYPWLCVFCVIVCESQFSVCDLRISECLLQIIKILKKYNQILKKNISKLMLSSHTY